MSEQGAPPPYPGPPKDPGYPPAGQGYPPAGQGYPPAGQGYPPVQQAYPPPGQGYSQPMSYQQTATVTTVTQPQPVTAVVVTRAGNCPNCRTGTLMEEFSCCGIVLAIIFFPIGLLCCLFMRQRVCTHCHMVY